MKHASGYKEYARLDGLPRHSVFFGGYTSDGEPICGLCTYPIVGYPKREGNTIQVTLPPRQEDDIVVAPRPFKGPLLKPGARKK